MILCVCPNPSIDSYAWINEKGFEKVKRITKLQEFPGGKAIHVAFALRELGANVTVFANWGGSSGEWIQKECRRNGILIKGVTLDGNNRKCYTFKSDNQKFNDSELLEPGPLYLRKDWENFLEAFKKEILKSSLICISGSWPIGAPDDATLQLIRICNNLGKRVIIDASGIQLKNALKTNFFGLHMNEQESISVFNTAQDDKVFAEIKNRVSLIALTKGEKGVFLRYENKVRHGYVALGEIESAVGSGDCLTAGILFAIWNNMVIDDILKYGVACGAANCLNKNLGMLTIKDVTNLLTDVKIKKMAYA